VGYKTKAAPTNAPAEATSVPTKEPNANGADNAMAALLLLVVGVLPVGVPVEEVLVDEVEEDLGVETEDKPVDNPLSVEVGTPLEPLRAAHCCCWSSVAVVTSSVVQLVWRH